VLKARLFHLSIVCCLILFALVTALQMLPDGMYDGAD
jgi:hypothetical protein